MKAETIGLNKPLVLIIYKYAKFTQTERKITNFIKQNIDRFTTLADLENAVFAELDYMKRYDKKVGKITTHAWTYCRMKEGEFKALSFNSSLHNGFVCVQKNWRKTTLATPGQA